MLPEDKIQNNFFYKLYSTQLQIVIQIAEE
jgi:hypothetical protein